MDSSSIQTNDFIQILTRQVQKELHACKIWDEEINDMKEAGGFLVPSSAAFLMDFKTYFSVKALIIDRRWGHSSFCIIFIYSSMQLA